VTVSAVSQPASVSRKVPQGRFTFGLCVTVVAIAFEAIAVATTMPVAGRELGGIRYYAWAFSLFLIGMLFTTVVAGRLTDRIGPAKPLLAGLMVFVSGLVVAGTAQHMVQLVGGRLVQGLGSGAISTAIFVFVSQGYAPRQRARILAYISSAWVLPAVIGPLVAGWLTVHLSWRAVFFAVIPLLLAGGVVLLPSLPPALRPDGVPALRSGRPAPAPLWAAATVALAAAGLQIAGQRLDRIALGLLLISVSALTVALPRLMPAGFVHFGKGLPAVIIVRGLLAGAFVGGEAFLPLMLVEEKELGLVTAGAVLTAASIGWMAGSWLQSRSWLPVRRDRMITVGCLSVAVGLGSGSLVAFSPAMSYWVVVVGWVVSGFGMGLATSSTAIAVMSLSERGEQGRNASSLNLSDALGSGLLVGLSGTLFVLLKDGRHPSLAFAAPLLAMSGVALLAVAGSSRIGALPDASTGRNGGSAAAAGKVSAPSS
jgi:MFS family permease